MKNRIRTWMPDDVESPVHVFRGLTVKDMLRIGLPAAAGLAGAGLPGAVLGAGIGGAASAVRPNGDPVDVHAMHAARHVLGIHTGSWPAVNDTVNGVAVLDNDDVIGVVRVASVDVAMRPEWEQKALQDTVTDLYASTEFPVEVYSIQREKPLDAYQVEADTAVTTHHFAVVRASAGGMAGSIENAATTVRDRCGEVMDVLSGADFAADPITGDQLEQVLPSLGFGEIGVTPRTFTEQHETVFRGVYVSGYPQEVPTAWLSDVLNVDGKVWAVQRVAPADADTLSCIRERVAAEQAVTRDPSRGSDLKRQQEDLARIKERGVEGDHTVRYGVFIAAYGADEDTVSATVRRVKKVLRRHRIEFREPWLRMHQAAKTASLRHRTQVGKQQVATSWGAAGAFPFAAYDMIEDGGIVFGRSDRSETPVVLDRFAWDAGHVVRMGKIGSGKSFAAKLEVLRSVDRYDDLHVLIIDPKQEYSTVAAWSDQVDRLTVEDRTADNTDVLVEHVREAYRRGHNHPGKLLVVVDEAHRILNDEHGRQVLGELVREGRDQDIACTLVTQNAADFTQSREGRNMLRQVDCYVFMRHQDVATSVEEFFNLSEQERVGLRKLRTGTDVDFSEAVMRGPVNTMIRIEPVSDEATVITGGDDV